MLPMACTMPEMQRVRASLMEMRGEEMLTKVEVLVTGNSSCGIDGAVGGE